MKTPKQDDKTLCLYYDSVTAPAKFNRQVLIAWACEVGERSGSLLFVRGKILEHSEAHKAGIADYCALGSGLRELSEHPLKEFTSLRLFGDATAVVKQLAELWKPTPDQERYLKRCLELLDLIDLPWRPKAISSSAHNLAKQFNEDAYRKLTGLEYPVRNHQGNNP